MPDSISKDVIALVPIGPISPDLLTWLRDRLRTALCPSHGEALALEVIVAQPIPLPTGYDPHRRQYLGQAMLDALATSGHPPAVRVLGLTETDCYMPGLHFIFGQAVLKGRQAFVALPRLRSSYYGLEEDQDLYRRRALKECIHELGHTWDLRHCRDPRCVMRFSNSVLDTDAKGAALCSRCHAARCQRRSSER